MHCVTIYDMLLIMDTFSMIKAFVAVVEEGSFVGASKRLRTTPQLVSKYVQMLEAELGVTLLNRTTRKVSRTEIGHAFFEKSAHLLEDYDTLLADIRQEHTEPRGHLRITVPVTFAEIYMSEIITEFSKLYPDITVNMRLTDRFVDLLDDNIDVAIRIGRVEQSALVVREIARTQVICCAAPSYLEHAGTPGTPLDLKDHACIVDTNLEPPERWLFDRPNGPEAIHISGKLTVNSATAAINLARCGAGIVKCPDLFVAKDLASGTLVKLFGEGSGNAAGLYALFHPARRPAAKIRVFIDFMVKTFQARLSDRA